MRDFLEINSEKENQAWRGLYALSFYDFKHHCTDQNSTMLFSLYLSCAFKIQNK